MVRVMTKGWQVPEPPQKASPISLDDILDSWTIPRDRCAVVIGVGKTGGLTPLESPIPGAKLIAKLFRKNRYDVKLVTDEAGPVTAAQIAAAIKTFIDKQPTNGYRLLVVYFSGHRYWKNQGDLWLLSNAPDDADEAVSFLECADIAQDSGIPNVVLISDACRSTPQGPGRSA